MAVSDVDRVGVQASDEGIPLTLLVAAIWRGKWIFLIALVWALIAGIGLYFVVPRVYQTSVETSSMAQGNFVSYLPLVDAEVFPYTPKTLHEEFVTYVMDTDLIAQVAQESGAVARAGLSDTDYAQQLADFVGDVSFSLISLETGPDASQSLRITARHENRQILATFVRNLIVTASQQLAERLATEIDLRVAALEEEVGTEARKLRVQIEAIRREADAERLDLIARLSEDLEVARSLGVQQPVALQALESQGAGSSVVNLSGGDKPGESQSYLQGTVALEERLRLATTRPDPAVFAEGLRDLERDLYSFENDPRADRLRELLALTPLLDPSTARVVRSSVSFLSVEQAFPRLPVFVGMAALLGAGAGLALALIWGLTRKRAAG